MNPHPKVVSVSPVILHGNTYVTCKLSDLEEKAHVYGAAYMRCGGRT